jgi:hypothetical protein
MLVSSSVAMSPVLAINVRVALLLLDLGGSAGAWQKSA